MSEIKIIVADDNKIIAQLLKKYIIDNSEFNEIEIATSSKQQIELTYKLNPDIVISDIERKGESISGLDIILNAEKENRKEKYIIITGSSKEEILIKNNYDMPSNVLEFIRKPFDFYNIIKILNDYCKENKKT